MIVLAHPGHWLVDAAYVVPVLGFLIWLAIAELRTRRARRAERRTGATHALPADDPPAG